MGNTGFDTPFTIRRKRNKYAFQFLGFLDGRLSNEAEWPDSEDTDVDPENDGNAKVAPFGYLPEGAEYLTGNLGVNGDTITEFTIVAVVCRDEMSNNEGVVQGLFGDTHYPRVYFNGTTLNAKIRLDGNIKTVAVANVGTYMKVGQPHMIVFRGSASTGLEVLIDGVSRGTQGDTGTDYDVGSGDFKLCTDTNLSYPQKGALRMFGAISKKMTDMQLSTMRTMLEYEGVFDVWRDNFKKWTGEETFSSGAQPIADSPYSATLVES